MSTSYTASDIEVLEGLEPVRKRPGMYIGGTQGPEGLHHLVKEILDNAIDEAMNGHADKVEVTFHKDESSITITDNGRGVPIDMHPKFKKPALEIILTTLHAGGKFSDRNYVSAGGLHGVGASVVNALSEELIATVKRDGYTWEQKFSRGKAVTSLKKGAKTKETGTTIFFRPDDEIFKNIKFSSTRLETLLKEKAFLNKGLLITFDNEVKNENKKFLFEDGLKSYLVEFLKDESLEPVGGESFYLEREDGIKIEAAFCWTESTNERIFSYVNGIRTGEGGTHQDAFLSGISKSIRNYFSVHENLQKGVKLTGEDIREGLVGVLSVNVPGAVSQLQFQGQTKDKLNNPEVSPPVEALIRTFENLLNSKPSVAAALTERITLAAKARAAARSASQSVSRKVGVSHRLNLPGKLADCASSQQDKSEIFIVEGDSAGGSAKQGRDRQMQAVLPLRGKVLNTIAASEEKLKDNKELLDLTSALGCGIGAGLRVDRLRYGKVIILTDADADGMHIASLLMAFFFKFMKPLVQAGHLYLGLPPLYRIKHGSDKVTWVYSDAEKDKLLKSLNKNAKVQITRFKGLGEMNPSTLWDTTLNPKTRSLLRVKIDNEKVAGAMFETLLGRDTTERSRLIRENAHRLELDL